MIKAILITVLIVGLVTAGLWSEISSGLTSGNYLQVFLIIAYNFMSVFAIIAASYLWLHSHNLKFYLWWQRQRHKWLPSKSATWDVHARWEGNGDESILDGFETWLMEHYPSRLSVLVRKERVRQYLVDNRFNVETSYEPLAIESRTFRFAAILRIYALTVNFTESKEILGNDVMPLLDKMSSHLRPLAGAQDYNLTLTFSDSVNPFLGLYVQRLHPKEIRQFQVTLTPRFYDKDAKSVVRVSPEYLSITTHSPLVFQTMARDFLSFAPRLAKTASQS